MKTKEVRSLVKGLLVDVDGAIAGDPRTPEDRHSAAASAAVLTVRLLGGVCINLARLTAALEDIADKYCDQETDEDQET